MILPSPHHASRRQAASIAIAIHQPLLDQLLETIAAPPAAARVHPAALSFLRNHDCVTEQHPHRPFVVPKTTVPRYTPCRSKSSYVDLDLICGSRKSSQVIEIYVPVQLHVARYQPIYRRSISSAHSILLSPPQTYVHGEVVLRLLDEASLYGVYLVAIQGLERKVSQ